MQQREEKQLESALESIIQRVNDLKQSLASMILKVENEYDPMNWPSFLDNYALISGQVLLDINFQYLVISSVLFTSAYFFVKSPES